MKKSCVISFANGKGNYIKALARLGESLRNNSDGIDFLGFIGEQSIGAPLHADLPYGFKIYAFKKAIEQEYKNILWVDSSCFAVQNIHPCFREIEENGFLFQESGFFANQYLNDFSLNYMGVTREEARSIKLVGNAGMMGLNMDKKKPVEFFRRWEQAMIDGCFNGRWDNKEKTESQSEECLGHRHDMVASVILHQMRVSHLMKSGDTWLQYAGPYDKVANDTIIWKAQGI